MAVKGNSTPYRKLKRGFWSPRRHYRSSFAIASIIFRHYSESPFGEASSESRRWSTLYVCLDVLDNPFSTGGVVHQLLDHLDG